MRTPLPSGVCMTVSVPIPRLRNGFSRVAKSFPRSTPRLRRRLLRDGKIDGALYLLMEYVEGANLKLMYSEH